MEETLESMEQERRTPSRAEGKRAQYRRQNALSWAYIIVLAAAALAAVFLLFLQPVSVQGASMAPTLAEGEVLLIDRLALYLKTPARGDMVIFPHPNTGEELIKRIIAFPGETIEITEGRIYVDGRLLDESAYLPADADNGVLEATVVPAGRVFVLGDHRGESFDSRDAAFGCIPLSSLDGIVRLRVAPFSKANLFL